MGPSKLITLVLGILFTCAAVVAVTRVVAAPKPRPDADATAQDAEMALRLTPNPERGREIYLMCAVCHQPEGWGTADGLYPQIAGQLYSVIIKQMADIRAGNRDTPTMFPFTMLNVLGLQQLADVAAYVSRLPMNPNNSVGPGTDLETGAPVPRVLPGMPRRTGGRHSRRARAPHPGPTLPLLGPPVRMDSTRQAAQRRRGDGRTD